MRPKTALECRDNLLVLPNLADARDGTIAVRLDIIAGNDRPHPYYPDQAVFSMPSIKSQPPMRHIDSSHVY
jgi:hypothetical protein